MRLRSLKRLKYLLIFLLGVMIGCTLQNQYRPTLSNTRVPDQCKQQNAISIGYSDLKFPGITPYTHVWVAALAFSTNNETLWIVYGGEPAKSGEQLIQLQTADLQAVHSLVIGPSSASWARFNRDATRLLTVGRVICPSQPWLRSSTCWSIKVWDTASGEVTSTPSKAAYFDLRDVAFSEDGNWFLAAEDLVMSIQTPIEPTPRASLVVPSTNREGSLTRLITVTISDTGNLVAYGTEEGLVQLVGWDGHSLVDPYLPFDLGLFRIGGGKGGGIVSENLLRLAIASDNKSLAVQSEKTLEIRDISSTAFTKVGEVNLTPSSSGVLVFSPSGSLLAVGHSQGLSVLRFPDLKKVLDLSGPAATAIAFSPDGCLLAWGDTEGTVRIINLPSP